MPKERIGRAGRLTDARANSSHRLSSNLMFCSVLRHILRSCHRYKNYAASKELGGPYNSFIAKT
jgi:hypothetical protein